jgi:FHS family L-fucose permease-like MFS transporter
MWGAIFTLSVNKLGKYTNAASGVFMIGVIGGAIFPLLQGFIADVSGGWRLSWLMVIACEAYMLYYAIWGSKVTKVSE